MLFYILKEENKMKKYLKIARIDHWIKNTFIFPGVVIAIITAKVPISEINIFNIIFGFMATCFISSANYVINEWLDAPYDKYHPVKKNRPVVTENMSFKWVMVEYVIFILLGSICSLLVNKPLFITEMVLLIMGFFYNVKPFRTKDIPYLDVISESVNNMLRLIMGWLLISDNTIPPSSVLIGYWMAGAFLMATKRFAEYRMIGNPEIAGSYRKSFKHYTEKSLLASAVFYALISAFCIGVFMIKYRIEYILVTPAMFVLYAYYLSISLDDDSVVQKPEKLYREKTLMMIVAITIGIAIICSFVDIEILHELTEDALIHIEVGK